MSEHMSGRGARRLYGAALIAAVLAVLALVNVIVNSFAARYNWYFYTEEKYEHTIGDASLSVLSDRAEGEGVRVLFCTSEDALEAEPAFALVLNTLRQLAERHGFVSIEFKNIYLHPGEVAGFRERELSTGEKMEYTINEQSVIFVSEADESVFRVESLQSFFTLDSTGTITAYNGEEMAISCLAWTLRESHPVAAFTLGHGENQSDLLAFYTTLVAAGYDIMLHELDEPIPAGVRLVIAVNPRWDFDRGAAGSGVEAELDYLETFLEGGGTLFVSLDPYAKAPLTNLRAFLAERGLTATQDVIRDSRNSIYPDGGYTLVVDYAEGGLADAVTERLSAFPAGSAVVREASVIYCGTAGGYTASPILLSSESSEAYRDGELQDSEGSYPVFAVSQAEVTGGTATVLLTTSVFFLANDVMDSSGYKNRDVVLATLEAATGLPAPVGCRVLPFNNTRLENLTMGKARIYAILTAVVIPLAVATVGAAVILRRKRR